MGVDAVIIDSILLEHVAIKHSIEALRQAVAEQATFLFDSENTWDYTKLKQLKDNHLKMIDSVQAFHDNLASHYVLEEKNLSPLFGKLVAAGNVVEHREIMQYLERAHYLLNEAKLLGDLKPQELMAATYNVYINIEMSCRAVETHEAIEANLFALLRKGVASLSDI